MRKVFTKAKLYFMLNPQKFSGYLALALALMLGTFDGAFAQTTDPWQNFSNLMINWINGNLGKTLTLLGMLISTIILIATHSWRIFLYGIILSVIIGGLVGIARTFHDAGASAFGTNW